MTTFYYFIQSLPECMGLIALSLAIARVPLLWGRILLAGALISVITFGIRALPVTFGLHLPITIFVIFLLIVKTTRVRPSRTILAIFSSFFTLALLELLISNTYFAYTHMNSEQAMANEASWAVLGVTQSLLLNAIALILPRFLKPSEGAWKK